MKKESFPYQELYLALLKDPDGTLKIIERLAQGDPNQVREILKIIFKDFDPKHPKEHTDFDRFNLSFGTWLFNLRLFDKAHEVIHKLVYAENKNIREQALRLLDSIKKRKIESPIK